MIQNLTVKEQKATYKKPHKTNKKQQNINKNKQTNKPNLVLILCRHLIQKIKKIMQDFNYNFWSFTNTMLQTYSISSKPQYHSCTVQQHFQQHQHGIPF